LAGIFVGISGSLPAARIEQFVCCQNMNVEHHPNGEIGRLRLRLQIRFFSAVSRKGWGQESFLPWPDRSSRSSVPRLSTGKWQNHSVITSFLRPKLGG
jgi:hypothetical protein